MIARIALFVFLSLFGGVFVLAGYQEWKRDVTRHYSPAEAVVVGHEMVIDQTRWIEREQEAVRVDTRLQLAHQPHQRAVTAIAAAGDAGALARQALGLDGGRPGPLQLVHAKRYAQLQRQHQLPAIGPNRPELSVDADPLQAGAVRQRLERNDRRDRDSQKVAAEREMDMAVLSAFRVVRHARLPTHAP